MNRFEINLFDLHFHAFHGVIEQENIVGNEFVVNATVCISAENFSAGDDDIADTVSYADMYEIIKEEMACTRKLLETVAVNIGKRIKENWKNVENGEIEIIKLSPPITGIVGRSGIKYFF